VPAPQNMSPIARCSCKSNSNSPCSSVGHMSAAVGRSAPAPAQQPSASSPYLWQDAAGYGVEAVCRWVRGKPVGGVVLWRGTHAHTRALVGEQQLRKALSACQAHMALTPES
jgi:hypothetical protein